MIIPDVNLLLYAYDAASPFHRKAARWWQDCLSGTHPVGLPVVVIFSTPTTRTSLALRAFDG